MRILDIVNLSRTLDEHFACGMSDILDYIVAQSSNMRYAQTAEQIAAWGTSNPLTLFGVKPSEEDAKRQLHQSFRQLSKQWHPDLTGGNGIAQYIFNHSKDEVEKHLGNRSYYPKSYFDKFPDQGLQYGVQPERSNQQYQSNRPGPSEKPSDRQYRPRNQSNQNQQSADSSWYDELQRINMKYGKILSCAKEIWSACLDHGFKGIILKAEQKISGGDLSVLFDKVHLFMPYPGGPLYEFVKSHENDPNPFAILNYFLTNSRNLTSYLNRIRDSLLQDALTDDASTVGEMIVKIISASQVASQAI